MTDTQIAALKRGAVADTFCERDSMVIAFVDWMLNRSEVWDRPFAVLGEMLSSREIVELLLLIGYFRMMSDLLTILDIETDLPSGRSF